MGSKITICGSKLQIDKVLATKSEKIGKYLKFSSKLDQNLTYFPKFSGNTLTIWKIKL